MKYVVIFEDLDVMTYSTVVEANSPEEAEKIVKDIKENPTLKRLNYKTDTRILSVKEKKGKK